MASSSPTNKSISFWTGLQDRQDVFAFPASGLEAALAGRKANKIAFFRLHLEAVKKNQVNPVIPSENILALCLNNYELISN
jgi:hypothetical protein